MSSCLEVASPRSPRCSVCGGAGGRMCTLEGVVKTVLLPCLVEMVHTAWVFFFMLAGQEMVVV